jgi:hypothetical protein
VPINLLDDLGGGDLPVVRLYVSNIEQGYEFGKLSLLISSFLFLLRLGLLFFLNGHCLVLDEFAPTLAISSRINTTVRFPAKPNPQSLCDNGTS